MDPISFSAAFLLSREPVTQPKLTESQMAVTHASAEPGQIPVPEPTPEPAPPVYVPQEPTHPRGPIAPPEPEPPLPPVEKPEPEPEPLTPQPNKIEAKIENARRPERDFMPSGLRKPLPQTGPAAWRLTDRFGTTWTYPDKSYLEQFVAARNATVLVPSIPYPYVLSTSSYSCSGGRCSYSTR